jgi:hypothetical protein
MRLPFILVCLEILSRSAAAARGNSAARSLQSGTLVLTNSAPSYSAWYVNTTYTITWASSGSIVQAGSVSVTLRTSPALAIAATLAASVPALSSQATFVLPPALSYGQYVVVLTSLADSSVTATSPLIAVSGGSLALLSPLAGATYVLIGQSIAVNWTVAGGTTSSRTVTIAVIYYGWCVCPRAHHHRAAHIDP